MFAATTPALISGAVAERVKFSTYAVFILLWGTLVYAPVARWVWAEGGWLFDRSALDFAGGTVVHATSGVTALVFATMAGPVCYGAVLFEHRAGYDDALDAFGVHGVGGFFGAVITGVFASKALNEGGQDGLLFGNAGQVGVEALGVVAAGA
jgi:ammonia channel protein AmtB